MSGRRNFEIAEQQISAWLDRRVPASQLRVGDPERESVVAQLGDHYSAGRLTHLEYDERMSAAYQARVRGELDVLLRDLPIPTKDLRTRYLRTTQTVKPPVKTRHVARNWLPLVLILLGVALLLNKPAMMLVVVGLFLLLMTGRRGR